MSLNASGAHDPYLICLHLSCEPNSQGEISLLGVGGTSASAPAFAGIMALVKQKTEVKQGQANYVLYRLASLETLSQCKGSSQTGLPTSTCTFNDITLGNNSVPGESGYGMPAAKYQAGVGYDLASGLGSVNITNLVNNWSSARSTNTVVSTFTVNPTTNIQHGVTPVNFNVTVTPQTGTGTPTGDVALIAQIGIDAIPTPITDATLTNGSASGTTYLFPGGTYTVIAHYEGDGVFLPSDSTSYTPISAAPESSSMVISAFQGSLRSPTPFVSGPYGGSFELLATVKGATGNGMPTGLITFMMDGSPVASSVFAYLGSGGQAVVANVPAEFFPPVGPHSISATYNGDPSFNSSSSNTVNIAITPGATQTSVQPVFPVIAAGQTETLMASVATTSAGNSPTGTVKFFAGKTQVGTGSLGESATTNGSALATTTMSTDQLPFGKDSLTAQYVGDSNYQGSTSPAIAVNVVAFDMAANPTTIVVSTPGQSGSTMLTFTAQNGFTGSTTLTSSMCSHLPAGSTCTFSPATIAFTASTNVARTTLTIDTQARTGAVGPAVHRWVPGLRLRTQGYAVVWVIGICLLLLARQRPRRWSAVLALMGLALMASAAGCGGGGGGGGAIAPPTNPGTPVGNYTGVTVTVTIAAATASINNLELDVQ